MWGPFQIEDPFLTKGHLLDKTSLNEGLFLEGKLLSSNKISARFKILLQIKDSTALLFLRLQVLLARKASGSHCYPSPEIYRQARAAIHHVELWNVEGNINDGAVLKGPSCAAVVPFDRHFSGDTRYPAPGTGLNKRQIV